MAPIFFPYLISEWLMHVLTEQADSDQNPLTHDAVFQALNAAEFREINK